MFSSMRGYQRPLWGSYSKDKWEDMETKDSMLPRKGLFTCVLIFNSSKKSPDLRHLQCWLQGG